MTRITIDIDDRYSSILSVTCIGNSRGYTNVHTHCFDVGCKDHHYVQKEMDVLNEYGKPEMEFKEIDEVSE